MVEPAGTRPVNDPPVIEVVWVRTKSSAVSISIFPGLDGREAVAIFPSGFPVLKKTLSAFAGRAYIQRRTAIASTTMGRVMGHLSSGFDRLPLLRQQHFVNPPGTTP